MKNENIFRKSRLWSITWTTSLFCMHCFFNELWQRIIHHFTDILNKSLASGAVPSEFKIATLTPILKSSSLDTNSLSSYRPVSNLPFLAKVLESAVAVQLSEHLSSYLNSHQSAFRTGHSVESALTHVSSSIYQLLDRGHDVFMVLLDLSAAFDTIDHALLLHILNTRFDIGGTVLSWLRSYLSNRFFRVKVGDGLSQKFPLEVGVPQGSILGPILFNCIMTKLADVLLAHDVSFHVYADDTQLWFPVTHPKEEANVRSNIKSIFSIIDNFMHEHHLKLNASKTIFLPLSRKRKQFDPLELESGCEILPSTKARNLGVTFDGQMSFDPHINELRKSCFHHIRNVCQLKPFIPTKKVASLILAIVISRLDFCNTLLCSLNKTQIKRIQSIQNAAVRMVAGAKIHQSITPLLKSLHWLPVQYRITYKLALTAHKSIYDATCPLYLKNALTIKKSCRFTRSSLCPTFARIDYTLVSVGGRSAVHHMVDIWNKLPSQLRNISDVKLFRKQLKTYLFSECFS